MTSVKNVVEIQASSVTPLSTSTDQNKKPEEESKTYKIIKDIRDWGLAGIFILWGGQSIIDRYSKPHDENIKGLIEIIDSDGDGKLSKKEKDDVRSLLKELQEWKKIKDQIGNIFGGK